ncbi:hypothetical protein [Rhizobium sp. MHM7A]|uniref:hypothetical protein n=1 Tax=Rhizobium sp. MHM7A TaxID=2583233 RepID=UPI001106B42C|nr:hypothetical protein [Rhizobium sp. MHM7A]TLX16695.1 hypothetical protein FFR93_04960 [Rhizobium sp. MHM7A]
MSLINAIAFGARHVLISKLHEDVLSDETITNHLRYKAIEELKAFVQQQMASMSTAEAVASLDEIKDWTRWSYQWKSMKTCPPPSF